MDLTANDDQIAFQTATAAWCRDHMPLEQARDRAAGLWDQLESMGLPRLTAPEARGGLALDHATEALVFAELGRFLAPIGLLSSAVANPDSIIRIAERMNGISSALTTKPARSWQSIARLPRLV